MKKAITDKTPDQLKFPFALWPRRAAQQLIKQLFSIDMPIRTVGEYLKRWGFTPQKPLRRAYEQNPKAVKKWLDEQYHEIVARAKKKRPRSIGVMKPDFAATASMVEAMLLRERPRLYGSTPSEKEST